MIVRFGSDLIKADPVDMLPSGDILMKSLVFHPRFGFGHTFQVPKSDLVDKLPKEFLDALDAKLRTGSSYAQGQKQECQETVVGSGQ